MISKTLQFLIFITYFLFVSSFVSSAQTTKGFVLAADKLQNGSAIELDKAGWKYHAGDDLSWANRDIDDSNWETLENAALSVVNLPQTGWNGIGWFRLHLIIAPDLANAPLNLEAGHFGASEIYLDGKLFKRYGTVGSTAESETPYDPNAEPLSIAFDGAGEHVLAVRYSNQVLADTNSLLSRWFIGIGLRPAVFGFQFRLKNFDDTANQGWGASYGFTYPIITATTFFSFAILHLLLFALYPRQRGNLFYSLFLIGTALNYLLISSLLTHHFGAIVFYWVDVSIRLTSQLSLIPLMAFLYTNFGSRIPRYLWIFVTAVSLYVLNIMVFRSIFSALLYDLIYLAVAVEITRIMLRAIRRQHMDAWIVAIGIFLFDVTLVKEFINDFIFEFPANLLTASDAVGTWGLALLITIYLARQFAYTSTNLDAQLVKEVEHEREKTRFALVEAENERRAKELEEARQLQLSMLPKKLPQIEGLEIAAYMKPATEVGGDYYDFHVGTDGTLTVAVGDATGHGLKAGTVVTATKSLFANLAHQPSISEIFKQTSAALKSMNLRGLFMAMTMLKIKDDVMTVSIAGMPSALVYRNDSKSVEEIAIRAMPLGSIAKTNYQGQQITLSSADVVVVMSDGFPEMFNPANDMLGFEKAAEVLPNIADLSAQEIISEFVKIGEEWANGRAQDDDVTFVVLKIGSDGK